MHTYEYFYQRKYQSPKYKFKPTSQALSKINEFIQLLDEKYDLHTLGSNFLINYFVFQFNRVHDQVFKRFAGKDVGGKVQIYDIIGKKAFQYWTERDTQFDFILQNSANSKIKISIAEIKSLLEEQESRPSILTSEEIEKKRFHNTDRGLVNCIQSTSLFNHQSYYCRMCSFKSVCKNILKTNYSHIYKQRGYE